MSSEQPRSKAPSLIVIVQARLSSSRLPGKVLLPAGGKSLLGHLLERVARSVHRPKVVVATTTGAADDALVAEARRFGAESSRGSEADVLERFTVTLAEHPADVVVRLTADNPLLDPGELDRVIGEFLSRWNGPDEVDYVTNHADDGRIALGLSVEVFSAEALLRAAREAREPGDREHVTAYLYRMPGRFRVLRTPHPDPALSRFRLTVDTPEDFELVRTLLEQLGPNAAIGEIARFLDAHPEVVRLNAGVVQRGAEGQSELRRRRIAQRYLIGRADASESVGYGHVARLGALLEAWTEVGGRALLVARGIHGRLAARLAGAGVELEQPAGGTQDEEALRVLERARSVSAAAIAIDGYAFRADYHRTLARSFPLLAIDDLAEEPQIADVMLNQNLDFDRTRYGSLRARQRLLAGAPYVLLRRELRELAASPAGSPDSSRTPRLAVCFGGSDPRNLTWPVTEALLNAVPSAELDAIAGPGIGSERRAALLAHAEAAPRLHVHVDPPEIGVILGAASALITAAGVTAWEALFLGVPSILVTVADNQRVVAESVTARGAALDAGRAGADTPRRAAELALTLLRRPEDRAKLSAAGRSLIDGRGVWRAMDALLDAIDERTAHE
jgi:spore coat polysaccharide biosynthesis protein SpsF